MIYKIEIENFCSIRDRQILDLRVPVNAPAGTHRLASCWRGSAERVPKVVAVFGANGSGKSNLLRALSFAAWFIGSSFTLAPGGRIPHVQVRCKPRTVEACRRLVKKFVLPDLGTMTIDEFEHISDLDHKHRNTPYQANRIPEVVRKMFNLAEAWGMRKDGGNPRRFMQKYKEKKRERFLTDGEFRKLGQVLNEVGADGSGTLSALTAIRFLMLTGRQLNEILTLRWENVDLETAELRLPDSKTGFNLLPATVVSLQCQVMPN